MRLMPKHEAISGSLREQIAAGSYGETQRLPSETALARRFGVSRPTAARALRDLQAEGLIERRVGSGTYVKRQETADKPALSVVLYAPGLRDTEVLEPICNEVLRLGQAQGMSVVWPYRDLDSTDSERIDAICEGFLGRGVAGVFFAPHEHEPERQALNRRVAEALRSAGVGVVLLDRDVLEFPGRSDFDLISIDHFQSAFVLTEHLLELGRRRFCFLARPGYPSTTDLRMAGCREAMARRGLSIPRRWARFGDPTDPAFIRSVLRAKPDAIVCANDRTAALLLQSLAGMGLELPGGTSIVGFDDVRYATLLSIPLTTIRQPCAELARVAVDTMRDRVERPDQPPRRVLLKGELVIRRSSGAPA